MKRDLRDLSQDIQTTQILGQVTIYVCLAILVLMLLLSLMTKDRGNCSYSIWQNITYLQLIHWIGLMNIDDNSEFESFFGEIALIFRPFTLKNVCEDETINVRIYNVIRIYTNSFINNSKELLLIWSFVLLSCFIILIVSKYHSSSFLEKAKSKIKYSIIIRLHLILFFDFITFSMINVYFYNAKNKCSTANMGFSIFFLILGGIWIISMPLVMKKKMNENINVHHDLVFNTIQTVVAEFKPSFETIVYQYYSIFLLYRFSLAFCLVILSGSTAIQLFLIAIFQLIICKIYIVFYLVIVKPYNCKNDAILVFITELLCLVLIIFIGIRSLKSLGPNSKFTLTIFCILTIWVTEFVISVRFYLALMQKGSFWQIIPLSSIILDISLEGNELEKKNDIGNNEGGELENTKKTYEGEMNSFTVQIQDLDGAPTKRSQSLTKNEIIVGKFIQEERKDHENLKHVENGDDEKGLENESEHFKEEKIESLPEIKVNEQKVVYYYNPQDFYFKTQKKETEKFDTKNTLSLKNGKKNSKKKKKGVEIEEKKELEKGKKNENLKSIKEKLKKSLDSNDLIINYDKNRLNLKGDKSKVNGKEIEIRKLEDKTIGKNELNSEKSRKNSEFDKGNGGLLKIDLSKLEKTEEKDLENGNEISEITMRNLEVKEVFIDTFRVVELIPPKEDLEVTTKS